MLIAVVNAFDALRNSRSPLPSVRPISGSFPGPKTISPTIKINTSSGAPMPNIIHPPVCVHQGTHDESPNAVSLKFSPTDKIRRHEAGLTNPRVKARRQRRFSARQIGIRLFLRIVQPIRGTHECERTRDLL